MDYVAIFHANLNYAFLIPENYERVIRASYEVIIDTFREKFPEAKYVFEASGYTIDQIAERTPDVLEKLKAAIESGQCEFMGSPYAHPIMANIPEEDGYWSCEFAMRTYEKRLGMRPEAFWNP
jgi:alpha-amylase/alpha-mannosidase (GH57 family)